MSNHCVLYVIESRIVLISMLPAMLETRRQNISVDAYVFDFGESHPFYNLYEEAAAYIAGLGFNVFRTVPDNKKYDVVYSAYPWHYQELSVKNQINYYVRFKYGVGGANVPSASYSQSLYNYYDFIVCLGEPDAQILSGHAKTVSIGNIKLADYKRTRMMPAGKKTVLYLPTWVTGNRVSSVNIDVIKKLIDLQDKYRIIAKMHSAMQHFENQREYRELFGMLDNVYDTNTPISDLLNQADVVLSDISGVAFDAVAGDVPLALFGLGEPVYLGGKLCLHQQLVEDDIVPGTNDLSELETVIERALMPSYFVKQQKLKKEIFLYEGRECIDAFMRFQDDLLEDRVNPWYIATRRALRDNYIKECKETEMKLHTGTQQMAQKQAELTQSNEALTQTQGELVQKQAELTQANEAFAQTQGALAQAQGELVQKQAELTQSNEAFAQTQGTLVQTQGTLAQTQGTLAQKQAELAQTQGELAHKQAELAQTQGELAQKQAELAQTHGVLTQTQGELAILKDNCVQLASQITAMENTKVWRLTKPLRSIYGLLVKK